jgi:hypothetical protein
LVIGGAEVGGFVSESLIGYYTFLDNLGFLRMGYMDYNFQIGFGIAMSFYSYG